MNRLVPILLISCAEPVPSSTASLPWDGSFVAGIVRPEHPRPDWQRADFINLNTLWDFAYDPDDVGVEERWMSGGGEWTDQIQLPFAWDAHLSGLVDLPDSYSVAHTVMATTYRGVAWYRLALPGALPAADDDWYLVLGAVDFDATVWVDGVELGHHVGGYSPFSVRLPADASELVIRVRDDTELNDRAQPVGKQGGTWYTRTSGIWQTAYLETRPAAHLTGIAVVPDVDQGRVDVTVGLSEPANVALTARFDGEVVGLQTADAIDGQTLSLTLDDVRLWSLGSPALYDLEIRLDSGDVVDSYFGLAEWGTDWLPGHSPDDTDDLMQQHKSFTLNGEPVYLRCVLDQSYYPNGVYTAPALDAIAADIDAIVDAGFNCVRLHIKPDEPVKYRLIDEAGLALVYDIPSMDMQAENVAGFVGRDHFEGALRDAVARDRNHPSLAMWVVFNENWGLSANGSLLSPTPLADDPNMQSWVDEMVSLTRSLDPSRPIEDNSAGGVVGVLEHLTGDSNSFHFYSADSAEWRAMLDAEAAGLYPGSGQNMVGGAVQDGDPWWNSEFAALSAIGDFDPYENACALYGALNEQRRQPRLVGWTLTQLTDVEYEENGLVTYDRVPKDLCERGGVVFEDLLGPDFIAFDWAPDAPVLVSGNQGTVPLSYAHWSGGGVDGRVVRVSWDGASPALWAEATLSGQPYDVVSFELTVDVPTGDSGLLVAEVLDADGERICANRVDVRFDR